MGKWNILKEKQNKTKKKKKKNTKQNKAKQQQQKNKQTNKQPRKPHPLVRLKNKQDMTVPFARARAKLGGSIC